MHHQHHIRPMHFLRGQINEIYVLHALRTFAVYLVSIFIAIFFLTKGYPLIQVLLYFVSQYIFMIFLAHLFIRFATQKGAKRSIIVSIPFTLLYFFILYNFDAFRAALGDIPSIILIGLIYCTSAAFYWMGYESDFSKEHSRKKTGKQTSIAQIIAIVPASISPLIGALIITNWSFKILFGIIFLLFILAIIPLFFNKEVTDKKKFTRKGILKKSTFKYSLSYIGEGIREPSSVIFWPILLFLIAINLREIGGLYALTNISLIIMVAYIGRVTNNQNRHKILKRGTILHTIPFILRAFFKTLAPIAIFQGLAAVTWGLISVPYYSTFYDKAKTKGIGQEIYTREIYLNLGRISIFALLAIMLALGVMATTALTIVLVLGGLSTLLFNKIKEK
jgi:MFS family permease